MVTLVNGRQLMKIKTASDENKPEAAEQTKQTKAEWVCKDNNIGRETPPQKKKLNSSKAALASLSSSSSSGLEPVPLMCSITKAMAQNLPHKLHEESEMLLGNLELHQQVDAHGNTKMYIRCSNCRAHSMGLQRRAALESTMFGFKEHFFTCSSTSKNIRDHLNPNRRWDHRFCDSISEYCTCLCDLYGLVDDIVIGTNTAEFTVKFDECKYDLVPGYRPNTLQCEAVLDRTSQAQTVPPHAPHGSTIDLLTLTEKPSTIPLQNKLILSDYDHLLLSQFHFICDNVERIWDGYKSRIQVCCKHCKTPVQPISNTLQFATPKPFIDHLQICHCCPSDLIDEIHELVILKEKQLNEITSIASLKEYTLKIIIDMYIMSDSDRLGILIERRPFPDPVAHYASSTQFIFPLIDDKLVECSSQNHPSSTSVDKSTSS